MPKRTRKQNKSVAPADAVTESQLEVIDRIEAYTGRLFRGSSKRDAQLFIRESLQFTRDGGRESEGVSDSQRAILNRIKMNLGIELTCNCRTCAADFIREHLSKVNSRPTEKQLSCIQRIESNLELKFEGSSFEDASAFISKHLNDSIKAEKEAKVAQ